VQSRITEGEAAENDTVCPVGPVGVLPPPPPPLPQEMIIIDDIRRTIFFTSNPLSLKCHARMVLSGIQVLF
jgi:hypothetical protein